MQKVILFYKFMPIKDAEALRLWQKSLCEKLNLKGRIIIANHGINGTLGGEINDLKAYVKNLKAYPAFKTMEFKWSDGHTDNFPRLSVKVRDEIVTFKAADKIKVNRRGIIGGGSKLKPKQLHALIANRGDEVVLFDGRNSHEAAIGKFKKAVVPDVAHTRDFAKEIKKSKYDRLKDKAVVTYCTGGIRCEVLTKLMKDEGFKEVYQLDGGIVKYGQEYADEGLWEGSLYVFDGRMINRFSDKALDIGICSHCGSKTSNYENCANKACNDLILICEACKTKLRFCPRHQTSAKLSV